MKKIGSLGEVDGSMSPPTQTWTRLCMPRLGFQPSTRFRKPLEDEFQGDWSYTGWVSAAAVSVRLGSGGAPLTPKARRNPRLVWTRVPAALASIFTRNWG